MVGGSLRVHTGDHDVKSRTRNRICQIGAT
jgi:hypothetical protein